MAEPVPAGSDASAGPTSAPSAATPLTWARPRACRRVLSATTASGRPSAAVTAPTTHIPIASAGLREPASGLWGPTRESQRPRFPASRALGSPGRVLRNAGTRQALIGQVVGPRSACLTLGSRTSQIPNPSSYALSPTRVAVRMPDVPARPQPAQDLTNAIVRWYTDKFGRGPTKAKTYIEQDHATVILGEVQTAVERTLAANGKGALVKEVRRTVKAIHRTEISNLVNGSRDEWLWRCTATMTPGQTPASTCFCSPDPSPRRSYAPPAPGLVAPKASQRSNARPRTASRSPDGPREASFASRSAPPGFSSSSSDSIAPTIFSAHSAGATPSSFAVSSTCSW